MPAPVVSLEQLQRVHAALRITVPLASCPPMLLTTLQHIAHCWGDRVPANLWPDDELHRKAGTLRPARHTEIDFKRRAAGDND